MSAIGLPPGVGEWIRRRRVKSADHPAVVFGDRTLTYAELDRRIDGVADGLARLGVGRGDRVAYLGDNAPAFVEALFGALLLGAVFVPLNTRLAPPELAFQLGDSGATLLLHSEAFGGTAASAAATAPGVRLVAVDGPDFAGWSAGSGVRAADVRPDDPALILYTSGTTGRPKGAVLTHGTVTWSTLNVLVDYDLTSADVALMISPLFHVASLGMGALPAFLKGATVVLEPRFDAGAALAAIARHGVTSISGVPTTYQLMADHAEWAAADLSTLTKLTCGGSPVAMRVLEAYEARGLAFTGGYGMTEAGPGVTSLQPAFSRTRAGSAGLPHFFTDVLVAREDGGETEPGELGEIRIAGPNVLHEYWQRPEADAFDEAGWFRTGDLGVRDPDGFVTIVDRAKDMIISGGENIYSAEVEQAIAEIPGVTGVAVIGVPDERWGEVPMAIVTTGHGSRIDAAVVQAHLDGRIARYKIPRTTAVVDELPRTASGKVRKQDLRARFVPRPEEARLPGRA